MEEGNRGRSKESGAMCWYLFAKEIHFHFKMSNRNKLNYDQKKRNKKSNNVEGIPRDHENMSDIPYKNLKSVTYNFKTDEKKGF